MSTYKLPSGRWTAVVAKDAGGKRVSVGTYETRKAAEVAERAALVQRDHGIDLSPAKLTVADLFERYLAHGATQGAATHTLWRYRDLAHRNIVPTLGSLPLGKMRPAHVAQWLTHLSTNGRVGNRRDAQGTLLHGGGLSPRTVTHAYALLRGALAWAVRMELVGRNVADCVTPPKTIRKEAVALCVADAQRLLTATEGTRWGPLFALALATGARRGELAALRWSAIDFERCTMSVRASLSHVAGEIAEKRTKTNKVRTVALGSLALDALRAVRVRQAQEKLRAGELDRDNGLVFANELGAPPSPGAITRAFYEAAKRLGLPTTSLHSLRHTSASWLLASGVDVRTVSGVLGHSTATTTLSVYAHLVEGAQAAAVAHIDERMGRMKKA